QRGVGAHCGAVAQTRSSDGAVDVHARFRAARAGQATAEPFRIRVAAIALLCMDLDRATAAQNGGIGDLRVAGESARGVVDIDVRLAGSDADQAAGYAIGIGFTVGARTRADLDIV